MIILLYLILFILGFSGITRANFPNLLKILHPFVSKGLHVMFTEHNLEGMVVFNYQKSNNQNIMRGEMVISPLWPIIFGDHEGRNAHFSPHDLKSHK